MVHSGRVIMVQRWQLSQNTLLKAPDVPISAVNHIRVR